MVGPAFSTLVLHVQLLLAELLLVVQQIEGSSLAVAHQEAEVGKMAERQQ